MKFKYILLAGLALSSAQAYADSCGNTCCTDSVDLAAFSATDGSTGLRLAWRPDSSADWELIGPNYNFVNSDFGPWGSHKKMFAPNLFRNDDGTWTATWIADPDNPVLACVSSPDLKSWGAQTYTIAASRSRQNEEMKINGKDVSGSVLRVPRCIVCDLTGFIAERSENDALYAERMKDDPSRFQSLHEAPVYSIAAKPAEAKAISDKLMGIFFEDINYAADGGLYAELVQNRDFEYQPSDRGNDQKWHAMKSWRVDGADHKILTDNPIHPNNPHYLCLESKSNKATVTNKGFDGISIKKGERYDFSLFLRTAAKGKLSVAVVDSTGREAGRCTLSFKAKPGEWQKLSGSFTAKNSCTGGQLVITPSAKGTYHFDMVSLFPHDTFKGRANGLRKDLAQTLADLHPRFVRFPGGCVAHGDGVDNIYDWKGSIGALEARKPLRNLWGYHQSRGLGYHEYFLFCEDLGAEPLPVLAAGVPCQNSGTKAHHSCDAVTSKGQQGGIPMDEMDAYIQDVLDLIEYANGDVTTTWGAKRAEAGHPEPFNLKYVGIGNEDMITDVFTERFRMIYKAVREKYPEIEVVGTAGPFYEGTDYELGWKLARELDVPLVDEHYYVSPGWFIYNQDYYDKYPRKGPKVYLGEYASHRPDRKSTIEAALTEAIYLTAVERNADVVEMTSIAPLLAKKNHTQWRPDLIYFDNDNINLTPDYYVQRMFGNYAGTQYIPASTSISSSDPKVKARVSSSIVKDDTTGDYIIKIANLLPVEVKSVTDLSTLPVGDAVAAGELLSGTPDDENARPEAVSATLTTEGVLEYTLPPYSFIALRIANEKTNK